MCLTFDPLSSIHRTSTGAALPLAHDPRGGRRRSPSRRGRFPLGRALHLIDLENLAADPRPATCEALALVPLYQGLAHWSPGDHVVVATNGWLMSRLAFDLPAGWQLRCANGPDGADLALLAVADARHVTARYDRLVVGSGDGVFTDLVTRVGSAGIVTRVVSRHDGLSRRLRLAAGSVRCLPTTPAIAA